jgi:hypothetical protein
MRDLGQVLAHVLDQEIEIPKVSTCAIRRNFRVIAAEPPCAAGIHNTLF